MSSTPFHYLQIFIRLPILKEVTSENATWSSCTFSTYLSSLLGVIAIAKDKYVVKVFNLTELHFSEVTSFKIGTLGCGADWGHLGAALYI